MSSNEATPGSGCEFAFDRRDDIANDVVSVFARGGGIEELAAAVSRAAIDDSDT
jgi:hypothetical protein